MLDISSCSMNMPISGYFHLFLTVIPNHLKAGRVAVWFQWEVIAMCRDGVGKGKERPGKEHGQLRSGLSHLVSLWENSVCCGAHSWGREKLKEADGHVFAFLQMKPQDQGGVWYGVEMSGQIWKCVWWVLLTHFNRNSGGRLQALGGCLPSSPEWVHSFFWGGG